MDKQPPHCRVRMTEEMARANLWATDSMIRALIQTKPTEPSEEGRQHVRRLRALEHVRENLIRSMETMAWQVPDEPSPSDQS